MIFIFAADWIVYYDLYDFSDYMYLLDQTLEES